MRVKGEGEGEGRGGRGGERGEGRGEGTITVINYKQEKKRPLRITCLRISANRIFYEVSVTKTQGDYYGH